MRARIALAALAVFIFGVGWMLLRTDPPTVNSTVQPRSPPLSEPGAPESRGVDGAQTAVSTLPVRPMPQVRPAPATLQPFAEWTERYLAAPAATRAALVDEGVRLAEQRRPAFKQLIRDDPELAITSAVPMVVRQQLPPIILAQLEKRVNQRADLRVYQGVPPPGEEAPARTLTHRIAAMKDGTDLEAHVYGQRALDLLGTRNDSLNGVSMDNVFAVNDEPVRVLETGEFPDSTKPVVTSCPVSGKEVISEEAAAEPVPADVTVVETPEHVTYLCGGYHKSNFTQLLYAEGGTGGPIPVTGILPAAPTPAIGMVKILFIPMTFADQNTTPTSEAKCYQIMRDVADYYAKSSFGKLTTLTTVTPPIKLPRDEAWYVQKDTSNGGTIDGLGLEMAHAREEAKRLGFDHLNYDCTVLRLSGGARPTGGWGGGGNVWIYSDGVGVTAHEIGHSFGLSHANFWDTAGLSAIGAGTNQEYGDSYDVMGGGSVPNDHYNAQAKNQVRWLPNDFLLDVTQSGTYRIHAFDQPILDPLNRYALRIVKDSQRTYWGEVRQNYNGSSNRPWADKGMILGWRFPNGSGTNIQLIDTTPGSPFAKDDAAISLGRTFSDHESGIHITTTNVSTTVPKYVDVVVNFGSFPGNHAPTLTLTSSAEVVPVNATVTFTATASDADGDSLAYSWQNDTSVRVVSPNAPVITRTFPTAGSYLVTCTVSDMKGGSVTRNKLIIVGNGNARFTISGRITDSNGTGVPNVIITANGANASPTDSDGYYTIPNLAANTYTMTPLLYGWSFSELFNNSVTVGPNFTGADFGAEQSPFVTVTATAPAAQEPGTGTNAVSGQFTLTRTGDISQDLVVNVNAVSGTATKTTDYTFAPDYSAGSQGFSTFTIPAESATLDVIVTPITDSAAEGTESVVLQVGPGNGYLVGSASHATVTIVDDPLDTTLPLVQVATTTPSAVENVNAPGVFTFTRTGNTASALTINYAVSGTATAGSDYAPLAGTVQIEAGASSATSDVMPIDDAMAESVETIVVTISTHATYLVQTGANTATVSIADDDVPTVTVATPDAAAAEVNLSVDGAKPNTGTFLVTRTGDTTAPLTVYYALSGPTTGETALHGVDYEALAGVVVIPGGASSATVTVTPRWDNLGEGTENVTFNLGAGPTNYKLGTPNSATITIADAAENLPNVDVTTQTTPVEGGANGAFRFGVRSPSATQLQVNFTLSGSAEPATDYTITNTATVSFDPVTRSGWIKITPSITSATFSTLTILPVNDSDPEELETLTLTIDSSGSYQAFAPTSSATLWLRDNDQPTVFVDPHVINYPPSIAESGAAGAFYLSRTGATTNALSVNYTVAGTATNGGDYDSGTGWNAQTSGTSSILRAVWGSNASTAWAAGNSGTILHWNGTAWSVQTSNTTANLHGVWGANSTTVWVVGAGGTILHWDGNTWTAQVSGTTEDLHGIWGSDASNVWAVGDNGTIRKWDGSAWSAQASGVTAALRGVWGSSSTSVWAVGAAGTIRRWTGSAWTSQNSTTGNELRAIWGASASAVWAVGELGTIVKFAGSTWASQNSGTGTNLSGVWAADASNVTVVGETGTIRKSSNGGTAWSAQPVNSTQHLQAIWGSTSNNLWAVGMNGTIQSWDGGVSLPLAGVAVIPAGASGVDVTVRPIQDTTLEGSETIVVSLAAGAYARGPSATLYLTDDETSGTQTVSFAGSSAASPENAGGVEIPVTLTGSASPGSPVTVEYVVDSGPRTSSSTTNNVLSLPYWVRVTRSGTSFSSFYSTDGVTWVQRGTTQTVNMSGTSYLAGLAVTSSVSGTPCTATIDNVSVTNITGGSVGTQVSAVIGSLNPAGTDSLNSGTYTITAGGPDISLTGSTDTLRYVYFPVSNSTTCTITARVVSITGGTAASKAGVMIRETTATGSRHCSMIASRDGNARLMYRTATNAANSSSAAIIRPWWVRLQRAGDLFTASQSPDGVAWTTIGAPQTMALAPDVLAGLAVSSRSDGVLSTATFDNVSLTGSPPLVGRSVGFVNAQGSESLAGGVWTVSGTGAQIGSTEDECYFAAAPVAGDFTLVARVLSQSGGAVNAQAGVMVRENDSRRTRSVYFGSVANAGTELIYRNSGVTTSFGAGIDYTFESGVLTFDADNETQNITLGILDDTLAEPDENITLLLRSPNGAVLGTRSVFTQTIIDNDAPPIVPSVGFAGATSSASESSGTATLTVTLSNPSSATVDYAVTGGSATGDSDFTLAAGTLTFSPEQSVQTITVSVLNDAAVESNETLVVGLSNPTGAVLGSMDTHTLTITDDDFPTVSIAATDASAAETGDTGTFTITRTGSLIGPLTVNFTRSGSAASGVDYTAIATPGNVIIPDGQGSATVTVAPLQDADVEGNQTVILTLTANAAYSLGSPINATVTIADDDRTVSIVANDPDASETSGNPGQFTVTRSAATTGTLTVILSVAGTASNGSDYTAVPGTVVIPANQTSVPINISPLDDTMTEGTEQVTISLASGSYDINPSSNFANVAIADNDVAPTLYVTQPTAQGSVVPSGQGVIVEAYVTDDGFPSPVTLAWSQVSGPGTATFASPGSATSAVTFSADGVYVLRITGTDGQFTVTDQVTVIVGSAIAPANMVAQDMTPSTQQRGQSGQIGSSYILTGMGAGYGGTTDAAHILARQVDGDCSVVARLTATGGAAATPLAGVTIRDSLARACRRAVLGYVPGTGLQFRTRTTVTTADSVVTEADISLPVWIKLDRAGNTVTASYASDVSGTPGPWNSIGVPTSITMANTTTQIGLTATGNSGTAGQLSTATFDNVTLTPAPSGPALVSEEFGVATPTASTFSANNGTYTIAGSGGIDGSGAFYGWQYHGDLMITAKLASATSTALSAKSGIMIRESMDNNGGYIHLGRIPQGAFSGYIWRSLAGGSGGGVPSFTGTVRWLRLVRQGNRVTAYHAPDVSGGPGTWAQLGQPQTIIMSTPVLVGFAVDNSGGAAGVLNTCIFNNLSIVPLNTAPAIDLTALPTQTVGPTSLTAAISDDGKPAQGSVTTTWSKATGPGSVTFGDPGAAETSVNYSQFGTYSLRLQADDTGIITFRDKAMTYYASQFQQWQAHNFAGNPDSPDAAPGADPEHDGITNFFEYAFGLSAHAMDGIPWTVEQAPIGADTFMRLTIPKNPAASDITYEVQATGDVMNPSSWNGDGLVTEENSSTTLRVRDSVPISAGGKRFMRAKITR